ncbi:phosphotransferase-like protein [Lysinibacillus xylanilyticus]|uniref:phosphotransferase-like protein n=1 Tax=Lysinibacillus xylanilyticus TaxID=582475 RepID=UPI003AF2C024
MLNGTSSSGKSTLSKSLKNYFKEKNIVYEVISIGDFLAMPPDEKIYEDDVFETSSDMNKAILAAMEEQKSVIIDHIITSKRIFSQLIYGLHKEFNTLMEL